MDRTSSLIWLFGLPCLLALVCWRTLSCPYTKVEESFTIQAVHDIISYGTRSDALRRYDHQVFPGAVPRSFVGPLLLSGISYPIIWLSRLVEVIETSADVQLIVRLCLAASNAVAVAFFCQQVFATNSNTGKRGYAQTAEQQRLAGLFLLITATQFHFAFWASRTIPNSIALPFVVIALALVCRNVGTSTKSSKRTSADARRAIWLLTFNSVVLRLEIVATLIPVGLYLLATRKVSLWNGVKTGATAGAFSVLLTALVDTYFWQDLAQAPASNAFHAFVSALRSVPGGGDGPRLLWPELHALLFNVVEGKSSEWGVSLWHAYFTSMVPKLLALTLPLVAGGTLQLLLFRPTPIEARARFLLLIAVTHISILSMLGHKEWRFVFYVLPALNVVAAIGASILLRTWLGKAILTAVILLQVGISWFTGHLSAINYPGGEALKLLHEQFSQHPGNFSGGQVVVHIDVLPAMTGVTLFQSIHLERSSWQAATGQYAGIVPATCGSDSCWVYDKTEDLPVSGPEAAAAWSGFTHLLTATPDCAVLQSRSNTWELTALPASHQPFEPMLPPVSSFAGLQRKTISQIKADSLRLPKALSRILAPSGFDDVLRLALPVVIVEDPAVWMCRRKVDARSS